MDLLIDGLTRAVEKIITGDREVYEITWRTLRISLTAILISTLIGIPLGILLGLTKFRGRKLLLVFINIGMGLPPVVAEAFSRQFVGMR
ncbi:tungstate transporter permease, partial [Robertmurraya sp. DFI.2.37]|nr:tungstate transporter permease [Robertmurraya sp. DFI.2.37]